MRRRFFLLLSLSPFAFIESCSTPAQGRQGAVSDSLQNEIIALEKAALDRWIHVDPDGYLELYAPDVTYFDPMRDKRVDGLAAMQAVVAPMRGVKLPFTDPRYEMIDPKVQRFGDAAILTFNVVNYAKPPNQPEIELTRWNSTEVYSRIDGKWKIVHSHWSFVKPDVKRPGMSPNE